MMLSDAGSVSTSVNDRYSVVIVDLRQLSL